MLSRRLALACLFVAPAAPAAHAQKVIPAQPTFSNAAPQTGNVPPQYFPPQTAPSPPPLPATAAVDPATAYEALIDQLVLTERDYYQQQGQRFQTRESYKRIDWARRALTDAGKSCWPVVMGHGTDRRPSTYTAEVIGPFTATVGEKCYYILREQVVSLPRDYGTHKASNERRIDQLFQPSLNDWLFARRDRPLEQIRIEVVEHLLAIERATQPGEPGYQPNAVRVLEQHLTTLRAELAQLERIAR